MPQQWDSIIIGGGAAGLWAAGTAALRGRRVLLLEKNSKLGVKILMSGGTRCNITHACSQREIADAFGKNGRVLLSVLKRLGPEEVIQAFKELGVATKIEATGKVFPVSDRAIDVRDALVKRLTDAGGEARTNAPVRNVVKPSEEGSPFTIELDSESLTSSSVLITTGGLSFAGCGTTGDGYPWVQAMGHTLTPLRPSLTPLVSSCDWVHGLSGITLDDASITAIPNRSTSTNTLERHVSRGGFLWTHFGCSGPTAMNVSRVFSDLQDYSSALIHLDLMPYTSLADCHAWLDSPQKSGSRSIGNTLAERIPKRLSLVLLEQAKVASETRLAELSKKSLTAILDRIKAWPIPIHGTRGYPKAEVTAGGVALNEVNFQDMQSRKTPGLFLAGEILDLDGPIGGYNFQAAWSTGHTAGLHL